VQYLLFSNFVSKNIKIKIYRTIILPVVLCGCKTWYLTLREECRLRAYENSVLRRIFWPKRDEVTGECRTLHNEELYDLYFSPNTFQLIKPRRMRWVGHVALKGGLERYRHRWEDNIKVVIQDVGLGGGGYGLDFCGSG